MTISVFIADDHTVVRDGLRSLLQANPAIDVVGGAATGRQTIQQVRKLRPAVVLIDISMPETNGIDAAFEILQEFPQTGIIILTMIGTPEHIYRALQAGARGYLLKESAGREVMDAILAVHEGRFYLSQPVLTTLIGDYLQYRQQDDTNNPLESLSVREREVLQGVVEGKTSAEIADMLFLSPKTVESYRSRMMHKLGIEDLAGLVRFAFKNGLI